MPPAQGRHDRESPAVRPASGDVSRRLRWMTAAAVAAFAGLGARAVQIQIAQGAEHRARLDAAKAIRVAVPAPRGTVRDVRGRVVAEDRPAVDAYVLPSTVFPHRPWDLIAQLAEALGLGIEDRSWIERRVTSVPEARRDQWLLIKRDLAPAVVDSVRGRRDLSWIRLVERRGRRYPFGAVGAHAAGYLTEAAPGEVGPDSHYAGAYQLGDRIGRTGVERAFERTLRGTAGHAFRPASARVPLPAGYEGTPPVPGGDLALSLDLELSRAIDAAFARHGIAKGAAVVLDVRTGELRALVSRPSFDPNRVDQGVPVDQQEGASEVDRALQEPETPGSIFKPFSALAALRVGEPEPVTCSGEITVGTSNFRCQGVHGRTDLRHALAGGCHVWFYRHAAERAGLDAIAAEARSFGLGEPTGIGIGREAAGLVPDRAWYDNYEPGHFKLGYTLNASIGQGPVRVTPLQVAVAYAALANGGAVLEPRVVTGGAPVVRRRLDVPQEHVAQIVDGLRGGPLAPAAAGVIGRSFPRSGEGLDDLWFAGLAPAGAPEVAVAIHGKTMRRDDLHAVAVEVLQAISEGGRR